MSDTNDPFAQRPYVPPTERDEPSDAVEPSHDPKEPPHAPEAPPYEPQTAAVTPDEATAEIVDPASYTHRYGDAEGAGTATIPTVDDREPTVALPAGGDEPPAKSKRGRKLASALAIAALGGAAGFGGAAGYEAVNGDTTSTVSSLDTGKTTNTDLPVGAVERVAQRVLPSVVQINVKGSSDSGSGTGIIISSDGNIITNNHVVEVAGTSGTITVAFNDGTNSKATIVGRDPVTDIAVIKADGKSGLTPATLGTSADLKVGQEVVAIGSPFGLESTVTSGIISALNRPVTSSSANSSSNTPGTTFPAVQTDAAINPGNSGGPLVNLDGNVIAINSAIRSGATSGEAGSIGLGFAIPIDLAKSVSKQLLSGKKVEHARIGVKVGPAVSSDGITGIGAKISEVTAGGAGEKAGLKKDDIITAVNGHAVGSSEALVASVRGYQPGEKITITYQRAGKSTDVEVTLDSDGGSLTN